MSEPFGSLVSGVSTVAFGSLDSGNPFGLPVSTQPLAAGSIVLGGDSVADFCSRPCGSFVSVGSQGLPYSTQRKCSRRLLARTSISRRFSSVSPDFSGLPFVFSRDIPVAPQLWGNCTTIVRQLHHSCGATAPQLWGNGNDGHRNNNQAALKLGNAFPP